MQRGVRSRETQQMGYGQYGEWLRSHVEAPTCETFTRLCEKPSCASSSLSHLTQLRKLAPHFTLTHTMEPSPTFHRMFLCLPILCWGPRAASSMTWPACFLRSGDLSQRFTLMKALRFPCSSSIADAPLRLARPVAHSPSPNGGSEKGESTNKPLSNQF